jgi:DNA topoisomerase-3
LHDAGVGRSADWLVGINASQALTVAMEEVFFHCQVQTPTLALICKRLENQSFTIETLLAN